MGSDHSLSIEVLLTYHISKSLTSSDDSFNGLLDAKYKLRASSEKKGSKSKYCPENEIISGLLHPFSVFSSSY